MPKQQPTTLHQYFADGYAAFSEGEAAFCPFDGAAARAWHAGWQAAKDERTDRIRHLDAFRRFCG